LAWSDLKTKVSDVLDGLQLTEAVETFNIQSLPNSLTGKRYCVLADEIRPNAEFKDKADRFYPHIKFSVNIIFDLFTADKNYYDTAITTIETVIGSVINPTNYSSLTRIVNFLGARVVTVNDNFLVATIDFDAEYTIVYS
jgi:hypothetical protein